MRTRLPVVPTLVTLALLGAASTPAMEHAGMPPMMPVEGQPGVWTVDTPGGPLVVRAATRSAVAAPDKTVNASNFRFDADGNAGTQIDTVRIDAGQTVRWHLVNGTHTVTNGTGSLDPDAGTLFSASLSLSTPDFDHTFASAGVFPFFCIPHEGFDMKGVVVVSAVAGVPGPPAAARTGFARPPVPNPARGSVAFAVAMVAAADATLEVIDAAGRRVATVHRGALPAGEHTLRWDGRGADGRPAAAGVYRARLRAARVDETRAFTLLR